MPKEGPYRDVEIDGRKYRIEAFKARLGSFIVQKLAVKRAELKEEEFFELQDHCLQQCRVFDEAAGQYMPVFNVATKEMIYPWMEYDIPLVMALTTRVLQINTESFIRGDGDTSSTNPVFPSSTLRQ